MSEDQKESGEKSITYTELADFVRDICMQKIIENNHKDDLLTRSLHNLICRGDDERKERESACITWTLTKTDKNALEYLREISDEIIFLQAQAGKVLGYSTLERR